MPATTLTQHPMTTSTARGWWITRAVLIILTDVLGAAAIIALLTVGFTAPVAAGVLIATGLFVAMNAACRWLRWRAWTEVPGGSWHRHNPRPATGIDRALHLSTLACAFACAWALLATGAALDVTTTATTDPRVLSYWLLSLSLALACPITLIRSRGRSATAWTLLLALAITITRDAHTHLLLIAAPLLTATITATTLRRTRRPQ
ncbi:MAG: hypothetical protein Q4G34_00980 [Micrococcus sp.]|nr:hypothetical protein [Micrococcus sp.]